MGSFKIGILGHIKGKVGTVVGSTWRGIEYVRAAPGERSTPPSQAQVIQSAKFTMVAGFVRSMKSFLEISYKFAAKKMTGRNAAAGQVLKNAVTGSYPSFGIDYSKVEVSAENGLPNGGSPAAASTDPGKINFTWTDNSGEEQAKETDKALVVAYCESLKKTVYKTAAAERSDISAELLVPAFSGLPAHTWIVFISENGKLVSASHYTGMVNIQ